MCELTGLHRLGGWLLMAAFLSLAIAFRGSVLLRGFSFHRDDLAAVSLAMYYPGYFIRVGEYKLSRLIVPLLQVIMSGWERS